MYNLGSICVIVFFPRDVFIPCTHIYELAVVSELFLQSADVLLQVLGLGAVLLLLLLCSALVLLQCQL